jgi:hypothetical protein
MLVYYYYFNLFLYFFEIGSCYVAQAGPELTSSCQCLLSTEIAGV